MTGIDRGPTRLAGAVAVVAALVAAALSGPYSWAALAAGVVGVLLVGVGVAVGAHRPVTLGAASLVAGVLAAGLAGVPAPFVLGGAVAAVVAWDAGGTAIDLGAQLGRSAETTRPEVVHAGSTALVGTVAAGGAWALYRLPLGARSLTVPALLLVAAFCVAVVLTARAR